MTSTVNAPVQAHSVPALNDKGLPAYFVIALISTVIPVTFEVGTLFMTASRLVLLFVVPVLLAGLVSGKYGPWTKVDTFFFLFMAWFGLAIFVQSPGRFVTFVGSNFVIAAGGYLIARCGIRGPRAYKQFIILYGLLVLVSLPFAIEEMRTSEMLIARWIEQIPGVNSSADVDFPSRNNLERVQFVFVHPIHYGLFCAYIFIMVGVGLKGTVPFLVRWLWAIAIGFCCYTSGSSGPFTGILIGMALLIYDVVSKSRWKLFLWCFAIGYVIVDLLSNRPAYFILVEAVAFNPGTAYGRRLILEVGSAQVLRTPIFGTPYPLPLPHWMSGSLDNYWLAVAVAYGFPAFAFLASAYVLQIVRASRPDLSYDPHLAALRKSWTIGTAGSMFALATVFVWSELSTLTYVFFGSGAWLMHLKSKGEEPAAETGTEASARPAQRYSRFSGSDRPPPSTSRPASPSTPRPAMGGVRSYGFRRET